MASQHQRDEDIDGDIEIIEEDHEYNNCVRDIDSPRVARQTSLRNNIDNSIIHAHTHPLQLTSASSISLSKLQASPPSLDTITNYAQSTSALSQPSSISWQLKRFNARVLYEQETIIYIFLRRINSLRVHKYLKLRRQVALVLTMLVAGTLIAMEISFGNSQLMRLISKLFIFISVVYGLINCNYWIVKNGFKSFVVWYKLIHSIIATIALHFAQYIRYIPDKTTRTLANLNEIFFGLNTMLFVMMVSLLDGYRGTHLAMKIFKYCGLVVGILWHVWWYLQIYFNLENQFSNIEGQFKPEIEFLGINDSFAWRSIALSSYSTLIIFFTVQLIKHIKKPHRINTVPALIEIKECDFYDAEVPPANLNVNNINISVDNNSRKEKKIVLIRQKTLFFYLFNKVMKLNETESASYSDFMLARKLNTTLNILFIGLFFMRIYMSQVWPGWVSIILQGLMNIILFVYVLNVNANFAMFKKTSLAVMWKLYNFIAEV